MLKASKYEASHKIRFLRVVTDDDVDRMQVYRQRCHSRALLIARSLLVLPCMGGIYVQFTGFITGCSLLFTSCLPYSGDYSTEVPPLPIPNREEAFRAAHTLKGVCLNLGFDNLYKASSAITEIFRAGELAGAKEAFEEVEKQYNITVNAIKAM